MLKITTRALIVLAGLSLSPALKAADSPTGQKIDVKVKQALYTIVDKTNYTVDFKKGSSTVSQSARNSFKALFNSLKGELVGGEIVVAGWSDRDFPMNPNVKLSAADAKLAEARINNVKKVIKELGLENTIQTINLGEQNSLLEKLFAGNEEQVKETMQNGETDSRKIAAISNKLRSDGGPQKVVVLVRRIIDENDQKVN